MQNPMVAVTDLILIFKKEFDVYIIKFFYLIQ
jgi:hypothetical protein